MPAGIFTGFGLLFAGLYRDRLLPAPAVEVAVVLATVESSNAVAASPSLVGDETNAAATPSFQASGWVEPDPYAVRVPSLIDGVVAEVLVLEGQAVEKGQLLARLVEDDTKLALAAAEGRLRLLQSTREAHLSALEAAGKKQEASQAEAIAAKTLESEADQQLARFDRLSKAGAVSELDTISARLRLEREKSLHQAAQARGAELSADVRRMERETQAKEDEIALAAVAVDQARLALARTQIPAPITGRVLRLMAAPGDKKMLSMDHPDSSTICILYEEDKLQVRVDVPLADAAQLQIGQKARIHTNLLTGIVFDGVVTRVTGEADLQRNTLQAKVRITNPHEQLRPEMLCRVEFFNSSKTVSSPANAGAEPASSNAALSLWIPSKALQGENVWVCDPDTKRLNRRSIRTTNETRDQYSRILDGLRPGEQVVLTSGDWREGQRVHANLVQP